MRSLAILLLLTLLSGCSGRHPFLMVQLCLNDEENVEQFIDLMKSISNSHQMKYVDRSEISQKELTELKSNPDYRLINISARDKSGVGWGAGNYGLSAYEVGIGFSEGSEPSQARQFAENVIAQLNKRWKVYPVPSGRGAVPLAACKNTNQ